MIPGITDSLRNLEALVRATAEAGGKHIFANPLFLKPCSAAVFMPFLEKEFPQLAAGYHQRYKDRAFLPKTYGKRISQLMATSAAEIRDTASRPGTASAPSHGEPTAAESFLRDSSCQPLRNPVIPSAAERFARESFGGVEGPAVVCRTKVFGGSLRQSLRL